jgi:hypothetical protein
MAKYSVVLVKRIVMEVSVVVEAETPAKARTLAKAWAGDIGDANAATVDSGWVPRSPVAL